MARTGITGTLLTEIPVSLKNRVSGEMSRIVMSFSSAESTSLTDSVTIKKVSIPLLFRENELTLNRKGTTSRFILLRSMLNPSARTVKWSLYGTYPTRTLFSGKSMYRTGYSTIDSYSSPSERMNQNKAERMTKKMKVINLLSCMKEDPLIRCRYFRNTDNRFILGLLFKNKRLKYITNIP